MRKQIIVSLSIIFTLLAPNVYALSGETWEVTSNTEMQGMESFLPESIASVCMAKGAEKDPVQLMKQNGDCELTDVKTTGSKKTWNMRCNQDGQDISGTGEVTYNVDRYQGIFRLNGMSDGQAVSITTNYRGKRVGTSCDPSKSEVSLKGVESINEMMGMANQQMASAMAEQCEISNYQTIELISGRFFGPTAACPGKEKFACKMISKEVSKDVDVYVKLSRHDDTSDVSISTICDINMSAANRSICKKVDSGNYESLADACPDEAKAFEAEQRHAGATESAGSISDNPVGTVLDNAKKLKGLFGF